MHRCFVSPGDWDAKTVRLRPDVVHHLYHVLRARENEQVTVFDGRGREGTARVACPPPGKIDTSFALELLQCRDVPPPAVQITLMQALPKGKRMDWIVEKAVELGVSAIRPIVSERVVTKLNAEQGEARAARWQRIAEGAARQCSAAWLPSVSVPADLSACLEDADRFDLFLLGALDSGARPLRTVLREAIDGQLREVALLIGPEGDLTPKESDAAVSAGAIPVRFGPLTMRLETAALFAMSAVRYALSTEDGGPGEGCAGAGP